ncbi:MAG: hypothetical protein RLZZ230_590 [Candidatus Parcubacteria bacterium]|jgi:hypothetical protein
MNENLPITTLIGATIETLKEVGESKDISLLLSAIDLKTPSLLQDFIIELSLTSNPQEEVGVGCYSLEYIERAYNEFIQTGKTDLLNMIK